MQFFYPKLEQLTMCVCVPGEKMMNVFVLLRDRRYSMFISDYSTNILFYVLQVSRQKGAQMSLTMMKLDDLDMRRIKKTFCF